MDRWAISDKKIMFTPLTDLWSSAGIAVRATKVGPLDADGIRQLLREGPVHFVVADVGHGLAWLNDDHRFDVWKRDLQPHLYQPDKPCREDYPDGYFYFADEWRLDVGEVVVVLERQH